MEKDSCKVIVYKKPDEWHIEVQGATTSDNEWQLVTTNDNEWQRMAMSGISANFFFFFGRNLLNRHPKENPLNLKEDLKEDILNWEQI